MLHHIEATSGMLHHIEAAFRNLIEGIFKFGNILNFKRAFIR